MKLVFLLFIFKLQLHYFTLICLLVAILILCGKVKVSSSSTFCNDSCYTWGCVSETWFIFQKMENAWNEH
jgi:hypothetical protein